MPEFIEGMRILHITPWFPEPGDPYHGIFIQRHIEALQRPGITNTVLHLAVHLPGIKRRSFTENNIHHEHKTIALHSWRLLEWWYFRLLRKKLKELEARENYTHVCFHIAYPALVNYPRIASLLPEKKILIEHWSAYHFNFNSTNKPHRLSVLFDHQIPLITVSNTLGNDISKFCKRKIEFKVIPNVVDTGCFYYSPTETFEVIKSDLINLLMHAFWKEPKLPFEVLQDLNTGEDLRIHLTITGGGPMWETMKAYVQENRLSDRVTFIENAPSVKIAGLMRHADGFLMPSGYETFSVVTAEALCCGCPVIVADAGALRELVTPENGIIKSRSESWLDAIAAFRERIFDRQKISESTSQKFSSQNVGDQLVKMFNSL